MTTLVLGTGLSGRAAVRLLQHKGRPFRLFDESGQSTLGSETVAGPEWDDSILEGVTRVVASPGFAEHSRPIRAALEASIPVISEPELAFPYLSMPVVAITGTNGKTTVTQLVHDMFLASGHRSIAAGNIGLPLSDIIEDEYDVAVVELSSFQLRFIDRFRPAISVLINVASDHLDWHPDRDAYVAAKARIVENQGDDDRVIFNRDDPDVVDIALASRARQTAVSVTSELTEYGVRDGALWFGSFAVPIRELDVSDDAFLSDLLLAGAAALAGGASPAAVESVARAFTPSQHRRMVIRVSDGVTYVDDSKATNPHAAMAAIATYGSVLLIAGGQTKGLDLSPMVGAEQVKHVFALGEAADELVAAGPGKVTKVSGFDDALERALGVAVVGDTVLLAPGCASFDMFDSFGARGDDFVRAVHTALDSKQEWLS